MINHQKTPWYSAARLATIGRRRGRCGRAGGGRKHLEFPAGGDQRVIVTRVGTVKAQHLNTTKISK